MLREDNQVFRREGYTKTDTACSAVRKSRLRGFIPLPSVNLSSNRILRGVKEFVSRKSEAKVLVVGGGSQRQRLDTLLRSEGNVDVFYSDVDLAADIDLFCDAHDLPFADGVFDAVIITAVLEHVLYPERVAAEIYRVLKMDGLLFSEIPFMQHVHEGAYDFTRYTLSGHKRLFNRFKEIESGMVAGPATTLVWSLENFLLAFIRRSTARTLAKALFRLFFFWLKYFDYLLDGRPEAMDGASCTYFLGLKHNQIVSDADIIAGYVGAKHVKHV